MTNRIQIGGGRWFDAETAECFNESTWWDGNNRISQATGSQWDHESLIRTASGNWILHWWSQWQGSKGRHTVVSAEEAQVWLIDNGHGDVVEKHFPGRLQENEL